MEQKTFEKLKKKFEKINHSTKKNKQQTFLRGREKNHRGFGHFT